MNPRLFAAILCASALIVSPGAAEFKFGPQTFTLPDGFVLERVAGPGLVERPIEADFDEQGRLYVTDSSGSNEPVKTQLEKKPHRIVRLEDTDGDGVFDRSTVFADKMMFPEGAMWLNGSLYVSAPPAIWKLTDTDGDGIADKREEWLDAKTLTGCANDLHGPYLGLDGWIYWCKGAFAQQSYDQPDGKRFETRAAHVFRRRPEGGFVEPVMTGGMDNPVGLVFTPEGERIFSSTFLQNPAGGKRDGLVHAIYGGVYGKVNDVTDGHPKTGDLMPIMTHLGPAAPCGLARYESAVFGNDYQNNLFACLFNLHKVTRHLLEPEGATFKTVDSDFLTCDSTDFHPTDVLEDADGSLLVVDTGGWYKICCPTSQLWKPDLLGAIYRIRRVDAPRVSDARGTSLEWKSPTTEALAARLKDARPAVVKRAVQELRRRKDASGALKAILTGPAPRLQKENAVWALTASADSNASAVLQVALSSSESQVQHAAIHAVSVARDQTAFEPLVTLLKSPDASVKRAAAEALGRLGNPKAVGPLLETASRLAPGKEEKDEGRMFHAPERVLEHSIIYALIELNRPAETRVSLMSSSPTGNRVALIALDQMESGDLKAEEVIGFLRAGTDPILRETANWVISHRKDWAGPLASYLEKKIASLPSAAAGENGELLAQLANLAGAPEIREMLVRIGGNEAAARTSRVFALEALEWARPKELPESNFLIALLKSRDPELVRRSAHIAAGLSGHAASALRNELLDVAQDQALPTSLRLQALNALPPGFQLDERLFTIVQSNLAPQTPLDARTTAIGVATKARWNDAQLVELANCIKTAGPLEISKLVDIYEKNASQEVGQALLSNLRSARALTSLHADRLGQVLANYPENVRASAKDVLAALNEDATKQAAYIDQLLPKLKDGDVRRGQAIFNSTRASCSGCHAIGYLGGNLGPDLTRIGQVRTERDLLESIVYPSASFVRSYEPYLVTTKAGDAFSGVLRKDAPDELVLGTGPNTEVRLARTELAEIRPGKVSVMPQGLNEQLTQQELADLLAFLKATRW